MTIARIYPAAWAVGEKLTSAQQNALDINVTNALDKRSGVTDTLESVVSTATAGRIVEPVVLGANANTSYVASGANRQIVVDSSISANRVYTFNNTDAVEGDRIKIWSLPTLTFQVTIQNATPTTLALIGPGSPGQVGWAEIVFQNGAWRLAESGQPVTTSQSLINTYCTENWTYPGLGYLLLSTSAAFADVALLDTTLTGVVGDTLVVSLVAEVGGTSPTEHRLVANDGGVDLIVPGTVVGIRFPSSSTTQQLTIAACAYTVTVAGTVIVKHQFRRPSGATTTTVYAGTLSVQHYR